MPLWIMTFFFGVATLPFCKKLPNLYWLLLVVPLVIVWFFTAQKVRKIFFQLLIFICGFCWALIYAHWIISWTLPEEMEGKKVLVTGYVATPPISKFRRVSFEFRTDVIDGKRESTKLKLSWYGDGQKVNAGERWQLLVRLKRPYGFMNPGGFDAEKHLLVHHIRATGYVLESGLNQLLESNKYSYPLSRLRQFLIDKMAVVLKGDGLAPVIIAFVTGAEDHITQDQWQIMRNTGTSYLVAISGLHVGLVASLVLGFVQFLWRFSGKLPLFLSAREAGVIVGLLVGFMYGAVSGLSIPTQRALVMLVMFSMVLLSRRYAHSWNAWLWSLFLVLIINPLAILTIGFWLSFVAVAAIIFVSSSRIGQGKSHLYKFLYMQLTVTLALLPFTLLFFQQISLVTVVANLIAMPVVCMVVVPLSLLGALFTPLAVSLAGWILGIGAKILHIVWWWLTILSNFSNGSWYQPIYNCWVLVAIGVGVLLLLMPRGFPAKYLGAVWLLPLFCYVPQHPGENECWLTILDVGQGLSAVVQTKNHVLLYDTGPEFSGWDAGANVVVPCLRMQGVKNIDTMVVSHGDTDHIGGAQSVLNVFSNTNVLTSAPEKFAQRNVQRCYAGQRWSWDGVDFHMLSPAKTSQLVGNNASCVLKVTVGANSILLPGDVESVSERLLVDNYGKDLNSTILVAPHHGSDTSSTAPFIHAVMPKYVLFPVGYRNRFNFPSKQVVARYLENKGIPLNTAQNGAITFKFNMQGALSYALYREEHQRFWHH